MASFLPITFSDPRSFLNFSLPLCRPDRGYKTRRISAISLAAAAFGQYVHLAHDRFDNFAIHIGSTFLSGCVRSFVRNFFAFVRGKKWPFYNAAAPLCCVQRHGAKCRVKFVNFSVCVRNCDFGCVRKSFTFVRDKKSAYFNDIPLQPCVQMPLENMLLRTQFQHFGWQFSILRTRGFLLLVVWLLFTLDHSS